MAALPHRSFDRRAVVRAFPRRAWEQGRNAHMSLKRFSDRLDALDKSNRLRRLVPRSIDGIRLIQPDGRELINFGSNDYLGLAAERSLKQDATGSMASALVCGWTNQHQRLADMLANLESTESACLFPTGFAACSGTIATIAREGDLILSDQLNHASLIDGCRLSRAECCVYPHRDVPFVEAALGKKRAAYDQAWIVTDGVFSMDGHVAPLRELVDISERYDATLIVDEAHGTGVLGENGSGVCEALGVKDRVSIRIGTLSKALGSQGGFVVGPQVVVDYLINTCRSLIYSTSLAPTAVAAAIDAIERIGSEPMRREKVRRLAHEFRNRLGITSSNEFESEIPIIPVTIGGDKETIDASNRLAESGFFVPAIRPPTVPDGTSRLRVSLSAAHDQRLIRQLAAAINPQ